jgi:hypothetical protein
MNKKTAPREKKEKLTLKQEAFCELYVMADKDFFGNGVECYMEVYGDEVDKNKPNWYKTAGVNASRLLGNARICDRINELLSDGGLNDQFVDKQLLYMITQHADGNMKLGALREYNKLKQRIIDRQDMTSAGKPLDFKIISYKDYKKNG